jgi:hypothetical protein
MINLGYAIYLAAAVFLVGVVGKKLHRDGGIWLSALLDGHALGTRLNNMLLLGYILVNIGYAFYTMTAWDFSMPPVLEALRKTGFNMLILSVLHFQNIIVIYYFNHKKITQQWKI